MEVKIIKETKIIVPSELLILNKFDGKLDVKPKNTKITWTDQYGTEKNITKLTDGHISNLAGWLRDRGLTDSEKLIQGELQRRCTGEYPDWFDTLVREYKKCPEIWRLKVY